MLGSPRVLFVDDEESILFALRDYFGPAGYDVSAARGATEAEALLAQHAFEVVIVDLGLSPDKLAVGLELVGLVRARHPATGIVLFTAHGTSDIAREATRLGAVFLEKPLPLPVLRSVIDRLRPPTERPAQ